MKHTLLPQNQMAGIVLNGRLRIEEQNMKNNKSLEFQHWSRFRDFIHKNRRVLLLVKNDGLSYDMSTDLVR